MVAVHGAPKPPPTRISLTLPAIRAAHEVWLLAAGEDKAKAAEIALSGAGEIQAPAAGAYGRSRTLWLLDAAAASGLPRGLYPCGLGLTIRRSGAAKARFTTAGSRRPGPSPDGPGLRVSRTGVRPGAASENDLPGGRLQVRDGAAGRAHETVEDLIGGDGAAQPGVGAEHALAQFGGDLQLAPIPRSVRLAMFWGCTPARSGTSEPSIVWNPAAPRAVCSSSLKRSLRPPTTTASGRLAGAPAWSAWQPCRLSTLRLPAARASATPSSQCDEVTCIVPLPLDLSPSNIQ